MAIEPDELFAELETMGEDKVRKLHAKRNHFSSRKAPIIDEWLRRKDQLCSEASQREQMSLAREANDAARLAATSAQTANRIATAALAVAIISIIIAWVR